MVVLVGVGAVSLAQSQNTFERVENRRLLAVAEQVAANPLLRNASDDAGVFVEQPGASERYAPLTISALSLSGADDVLLLTTSGVVVTSADPSLVGTRLALGESTAPAGRAWTGTARVGGRAVRVAPVPVTARTGAVEGIAVATRVLPGPGRRLLDARSSLLTYLGLAGAVGLLGSWLLGRRLKRQTLGLEPAEIASLFEHREAMLHGIREGVVAVDPAGRVTLVNDGAAQLLGLGDDVVGSALDDLALDPRLRDVLAGAVDGRDAVVVVGSRVLVLNRRAVSAAGRPVGSVTTLRDRTDLSALRREVGAVRSTADLLRAQTHEFANQLHTISGLIQIGETDEVVRYVEALTRHREQLDHDLPGRVADPVVSALLAAKASVAAERGVTFRVAPGARLGRLDPDTAADIATVLGNLVDNALDVVAYGNGHVEVDLREAGDEAGEAGDVVEVVVADDGPGVPPGLVGEVFRHGFSTKVAAEGGERGIGLALSRQVCRRRGGDLAVADAVPGPGAVFTARMPAARRAGAGAA
ncbi:MAG: Spo0B domain-containing protein [Actinobacteria bacterium]|nr:Spo0B domain-containing protein [Actinomycetota bacterium]